MLFERKHGYIFKNKETLIIYWVSFLVRLGRGRVSNCYSMPSDQFFSHLMARTNCFSMMMMMMIAVYTSRSVGSL